MASPRAMMSGAAISVLKSITEAFEKTVKNKVSKTPVPMMYAMSAFLAVSKAHDRIMIRVRPIIKRAGESP